MSETLHGSGRSNFKGNKQAANELRIKKPCEPVVTALPKRSIEVCFRSRHKSQWGKVSSTQECIHTFHIGKPRVRR